MAAAGVALIRRAKQAGKIYTTAAKLQRYSGIGEGIAGSLPHSHLFIPRAFGQPGAPRASAGNR